MWRQKQTCSAQLGRITDGNRCSWTTLWDSTLSSPISAPTLLEWPCQGQRWSGLITSTCSCLHNLGTAPSVACECGAEEQAVGHLVLHCPIHRPPYEVHGLTFWMTRQWNGCSEPAPYLVRPSSGLQELAQKIEADVILISALENIFKTKIFMWVINTVTSFYFCTSNSQYIFFPFLIFFPDCRMEI